MRAIDSMKKLLYCLMVLSVSLSTPAFAKDACTSVLCLAGMLQGTGEEKECEGAIKDYFSIVKFKLGSISLTNTFNARGKFLNQCKSADNWPDDINAVYGMKIL